MIECDNIEYINWTVSRNKFHYIKEEIINEFTSRKIREEYGQDDH
jgi:hypothetical protein